MEILITFAITAIIYIIGFLVICNIVNTEVDVHSFAKRTICVLGINIALLILCNVYVITFTASQSAISLVAQTLVSLLMFGGFACSKALPREKLAHPLKACAILCIIPFLLEIFVFNAKSIDITKEQTTIPLSDATTNEPEYVTVNNDNIYFKKDGSITVNVDKENIGCAELYLTGSDAVTDCGVWMTDDNYSSVRICVGDKKISPSSGYCSFVLTPYGQLHQLTIALEEVQSPITITGITLFSAAPFDFSLLRFMAITVLAIIIYLIYYFRLYKVVYNRQKTLHKGIIAALLALCLCSTFMFTSQNQGTISYKNTNISSGDHYVQMFDSIQKGQANLDLAVDPKLTEMENPYDPSIRSANNVNYYWDTAFYDGQYYSYFGVVPVLVFYYPIYFMSGGNLPTMNVTCQFFSILSIICLFGVILTAIKKFIKRPNMLIVCVGLLSTVFTSGIYYALDFSNIYFAAVISSMSFLLLCLWTGLASYKEKSYKKQILLLLVSGLSFILCVGCRPTMALNALILAPLFIFFLMNRDYSIKHKVCLASSFLLPIIIGGAGLMWYNYIRFDSFFEFGASYQLTVSNIQANTVKLSDFPSAIIQYLLQPTTFTSQFPHIELTPTKLANYSHYTYCDLPLALINFPSIVLALAILPLILKNFRKGDRRLDPTSNIKFFSYILIAALSVIIIWLDFCMAGATIRYLLDILPTMTILSLLVFLEFNSNMATSPSVQHKSTAAICTALGITSFIVFLHLLTFTEHTALFQRFPNILGEMQSLFEWWC